jgi:hypothetical protein
MSTQLEGRISIFKSHRQSTACTSLLHLSTWFTPAPPALVGDDLKEWAKLKKQADIMPGHPSRRLNADRWLWKRTVGEATGPDFVQKPQTGGHAAQLHYASRLHPHRRKRFIWAFLIFETEATAITNPPGSISIYEN